MLYYRRRSGRSRVHRYYDDNIITIILHVFIIIIIIVIAIYNRLVRRTYVLIIL